MKMFEHFSDEQLLLLEDIVNNFDPENIVKRLKELPKIDGYSLTANGCLYKNDSHGFLTSLMERIFNDRIKYKQLMLEAQKRFEQTKSKEDEKKIARYKNFQMAKKIQLNSLYGALSNKYFRWFNFDNAESITTTGQVTILFIADKMNQFMNKLLKTDADYVIASDTDSIYVEMNELVEKAFPDADDLKIVDALDKFIEAKVQPFMDDSYQELADMMNAYQQKMKMKRETIANKGIWRGKKMYILNAWNIEGVQYSEPKLKLQGIEAVRSSTPHACRESIKEALGIIMNEDEQNLQEYIERFKNKFLELPFEDVAFPRGVKGLEKYRDSASIYKKSTPIHVKGALLFNHLLKQKNIKRIPPIQNGDKIRFAYLKVPNPLKDSVIATPDELPDELELNKYIDRDLQFEKAFLEPIRSITSIIGWEVEKKSTLEDFFS